MFIELHGRTFICILKRLASLLPFSQGSGPHIHISTLKRSPSCQSNCDMHPKKKAFWPYLTSALCLRRPAFFVHNAHGYSKSYILSTCSPFTSIPWSFLVFKKCRLRVQCCSKTEVTFYRDPVLQPSVDSVQLFFPLFLTCMTFFTTAGLNASMANSVVWHCFHFVRLNQP